MLYTFELTTYKQDEWKDLTHFITEVVNKSQVKEGQAVIYCPHTTAGITINENADPDVVADIQMRFHEVFPWNHPKYQHLEGNTAAHLKAVTVGSSQTVIINEGKLLLGTWQGIFFCEFDGPRTRTVHIKIMS